MEWSQWIAENKLELRSILEGTTLNLSKKFSLASGCKVEKSRQYKPKSAKYWMEIRRPLDQVRLITVQFHEGTQGQFDLIIWTYLERQDIWCRFETGQKFSFRNVVLVRANCQPSGTWRDELQAEKAQVRGVRFSGKLSDFDEPSAAHKLLPELLEAFCEFVITCHSLQQPESLIITEFMNERTVSPPIFLDETIKREDIRVSQFAAHLQALGVSEREALVKMRVGQSLFRDQLVQRWDGACSVTGLQVSDVLIASHILAWSRCRSASERWDVDNGLLLTPSLDKAFDLGYISFDSDGETPGRMIVSARASIELRQKLQLDDTALRIRKWYPGQAKYLTEHRRQWGL